MDDRRTVVITGASGTVGSCLTGHLGGTWPGRLCAVGRTRPARSRAGDTFLDCDLADPAATARAATRLAAGPPVTALVCAAGIDSRAGLHDLDPGAVAMCMQVNCLAHLQLLRAALAARPSPAAVFPVAVVSSDVVGKPMPATAVYAAAKAAVEEAFRHATADVPEPGLAVLLVRLPDIGVPMRATAPGTEPPPRTGGQHPLPVLTAAAEAITRFVTTPGRTAGVEVWHA
jgi:NAD(P)-dependent dehydrogenase (short-subunit alcohol dehydrogenase family)